MLINCPWYGRVGTGGGGVTNGVHLRHAPVVTIAGKCHAVNHIDSPCIQWVKPEGREHPKTVSSPPSQLRDMPIDTRWQISMIQTQTHSWTHLQTHSLQLQLTLTTEYTHHSLALPPPTPFSSCLASRWWGRSDAWTQTHPWGRCRTLCRCPRGLWWFHWFEFSVLEIEEGEGTHQLRCYRLHHAER